MTEAFAVWKTEEEGYYLTFEKITEKNIAQNWLIFLFTAYEPLEDYLKPENIFTL